MQRFAALVRPALIPALALVTAFLLGAVVIVLTDFEHLQHLGTDPGGALAGAVGTVVEAYGAMLGGAIGDPIRIVGALGSGDPNEIANAIRPISEVLVTATPFIFVGLGLVVSFRAGLLNLGADGQFLIGGLGAVITASLLAGLLPSFLILVLGLLGGAASGAAYGFIPGILKARSGAHEVITTLMLTLIAPQVMLLVLSSGQFSRSLTSIVQVPLLSGLPSIRVDWGFLVALLTAAVVSFLLFRTNLGLEIRATGLSPAAARAAGMRPGRSVVMAMVLSGGLAGLGSAFLALGPVGGIGFVGNLGFIAIALALIGGRRPSGLVVAALLYSVLESGAKNMVIVTDLSLSLLMVIVTLTLLFVAAPGLIRSIWRLKPPRVDSPAPMIPAPEGAIP